jgi:DNA polymerase-3 subunit delta'
MARSLVAEFAKSSEYGILKTLFGADGKKALMREGVYLFSEIARDACVFSLGGGADMTISCDRQGAKKIAGRLLPEECVQLYDTLCEYIKRIDSNCNLTLTADSLTCCLMRNS